MEITAEIQEKYLKNSGACPFCGSESLEGEERDYGTDELYQRIHCYSCGKTWDDVYVLSRFEEVE